MVERIGYEDAADAVNHNPKRIREAGLRRWSAISALFRLANAGYSVDSAGRSVPSPYQMIVGIGDEQVASGIHGNA
jgi:hypothetical protein